MFMHSKCIPHHLPAGIYGFLAKKNIKFYFPATTELNIARVNLFRKPSDLLILMAIDALIAIRPYISLGEPNFRGS